MRAFLLRRLGLMLVALIGVLVIMFVLMHLAPVDPARQYAGNMASEEKLEQVREDLGLNEPLYVQIVLHLKNYLTGKWGDSLRTKQPVLDDIVAFLPDTLELVVIAMLLTLLIGIPMGVYSAEKKDRWPDHSSRILAVGLISIPTFWLALALQYVFAGQFPILPLSGPYSQTYLFTNPVQEITGFPLIDTLISGNFGAFIDHVTHLVLPVIALMAMALGGVQRITRAAMVETLSDDYVVAKRSYGLGIRSILYKHGLRNASGPIATYSATTFAWLLVNTFLVELIFNWPGIGLYLTTGVAWLDYPVVVGVTFISAVAFLLSNLVADSIVAMDPRVRMR